MTRRRNAIEDMPSLLDVFVEVRGTGEEIRAEYVRRWLAWHSANCASPKDCQHRDPHGKVPGFSEGVTR